MKMNAEIFNDLVEESIDELKKEIGQFGGGNTSTDKIRQRIALQQALTGIETNLACIRSLLVKALVPEQNGSIETMRRYEVNPKEEEDNMEG